MRSEFITWMDRFYRESPRARSSRIRTPRNSRSSSGKGIEHERAFLESLAAGGRRVCDLTDCRDDRGPRWRRCAAAKRSFIRGISRMTTSPGIPDFLVRVETPSVLGAWSYEPWDTKLARHPKPYFLVQLCCYAEMLERRRASGPSGCASFREGPGAEPARVPDGRFLLLLPRAEERVSRSTAGVRSRPAA